jgi:alcohol dehydrogenase
LKLLRNHQIEPGRFVTHHFALDEVVEAYDVFARAADTGALKVVLSGPTAGSTTSGAGRSDD